MMCFFFRLELGIPGTVGSDPLFPRRLKVRAFQLTFGGIVNFEARKGREFLEVQ